MARPIRRGAVALLLCAFVVVVSGASGRLATLPQQSGIVDLLNGANLRIPGVPGIDIQSGASAGDVNGDGLNDIILGAPEADANGQWSGSVFVVYGRRSPGTIDLNALGTGGFRINGAAAGDFFGESVASLGDMTGDGLSEVAVSAPFASPRGRTGAGAVYVIFGAPSSGGFPLSQIGAYGFEIDGPIANGLAGPLAGGDVNGDGRADVIIRAGSSTYVVFGRPRGSNETIDLAGLGSAGFRIDGNAGDVATGDVNGDGRADVIIGDSSAAANGPDSGAAYVVYGKTSTATVSLAALGTGGFRIDGAGKGDYFGYSVASVGDMTGDGRAEVVVGAPFASPRGRTGAGAVYVIFGAPSSGGFPLSQIGAYGFEIDGAIAGDWLGNAVSGVGDVNGDGRADLIRGCTPRRQRQGPGGSCLRRLRARTQRHRRGRSGLTRPRRLSG